MVSLLFLLFAPLSIKNLAAEQVAREYDLKAALLYQFSRFISWPDDVVTGSGKFQVCVMGKDPFGNRLDGLKKRKYLDYQIDIYYPQNLEDAKHCQILYIEEPDCSLCRELKHPVLLVSSMEGFVDKGGEIELVKEGERIRFYINADSIRLKNLKASAKLYEVASRVVGDVSN